MPWGRIANLRLKIGTLWPLERNHSGGVSGIRRQFLEVEMADDAAGMG